MNDNVEFVITLPSSLGNEVAFFSRARATIGVLVQIIASAMDELVIAAPYIRGEEILGKGIIQYALQHAVEKRKINLSIVSTGESMDSITSLPWIRKNKSTVAFYCPKANIEPQKFLGSHAKFCIADKKIAYIGSANLTFLGLNQHLEMGVLVHDELALQVYDLWKLLIYKEFFIEV